MVAPINANVSFEVEGEKITLRLDWQAVAMIEEQGASLFGEEGLNLTLSKCALLVKCMAISTRPDMSLDEAMAIVIKHGIKDTAALILELIARFGGKPSEEEPEGNGEAVAA